MKRKKVEKKKTRSRKPRPVTSKEVQAKYRKDLKRKAKKPPIISDTVFATMLIKKIRVISAYQGELTTKIERLPKESSLNQTRILLLEEVLKIYGEAVEENERKKRGKA